MSAPYEQQPRESSKAFASFIVYRDMGHSRTLAGAAKLRGMSGPYFEDLAGRHAWSKRVRAWDMEVDRRKRKADLDAIEKMRARHVDQGVALQGLGAAELRKHIAVASASATITLKVEQVLDLIEAGTKLERISRGEPGEIVQHAASKLDLTKLTTDELISMRRMQNKLRKAEGE